MSTAGGRLLHGKEIVSEHVGYRISISRGLPGTMILGDVRDLDQDGVQNWAARFHEDPCELELDDGRKMTVFLKTWYPADPSRARITAPALPRSEALPA